MDSPRSKKPWIFLALAALVAMVLATLVARFGARLPQAAQGDDLLSVLFGDARAVISLELHRQADSTLHGGVDMNYHHDDEEEDHENDETCNHDHDDHDDHETHVDQDTQTPKHPNTQTPPAIPDPWAWINARIRPPQIDRHLAREKMVEMLPWFWAAVRTDPHNVKAWTDAWYAASHMMKDAAMATRIIDEARRSNPESPEILFYAARDARENGRPLAEVRGLFEEAKRLVQSRAGTAEETEDDVYLLRGIDGYLEAFEKNGDSPRKNGGQSPKKVGDSPLKKGEM